MTTEQLTLTPAQQTVHPDGRGTPTQRWDRLVATNPHLKPELVATARQLIDAGHRATINRCFEEMRDRVHTVGSDWRLDNSVRAPAAAWMREAHPDLAVHMRTRRDRRA